MKLKSWLIITEDQAKLILRRLSTDGVNDLDELCAISELKLELRTELGKLAGKRIVYNAKKGVKA